MKKTCTNCTAEFDTEDIFLGERLLWSISTCDPCNEKLVAEQAEREKQEALNARKTQFWCDVPTLYQDTDKTKLQANLVAAIDGWEYGAKGLGMIGKSGAGKTRASVLLLQRIAMTGKSICFMKAVKLTNYARDKFSDDYKEKEVATERIRQAYRSKLLLIDDIGKGRLSPTAEELLFDIVDERSERGLPIIWTSNSGAKALREMLSPDRADALIRRLAEFTTITHVQ
jgi:DNA replication protein DnaC